MRLILLSPVKTLFDGDVELVTIPGTKGQFTVLPNHAPLITSVGEGVLTYKVSAGETVSLHVGEGFADVRENEVSVCVESCQPVQA